MSTFNFLIETNLNLGTDFKSTKELWAYARVASDRLKKQWLDSDRTDYSIYKDPDYIYEGLLCYKHISHHCALMIDRYHRAFDVEKGTLLDIYNGVGLTSVYAALAGFEVSVVNDNPAQVDYMQKTARRHLGRELRVFDSLPAEKFDVVCSFEVLEHFTHPLDALERQIACVADDGIFAESTGFADPTLLGHFETYTVGSDVVTHRKVSKFIQKRLESEMRQHAHGIQNKPRVWEKVAVGYDKKPRLWTVPKTGNRELFRGFSRQMEEIGLEPHFVGELTY